MVNSPVLSWFNGQAHDTLSVSDRGLQYGDGFFTTILVVDDFILNWASHWRRLQNSVQSLAFPELDEQQLLNQIKQVLQSSITKLTLNCPTKVLKLIVTRGEAGRGYQIPNEVQTNLIIQLSKAPAQLQLQCVENELTLTVPDSIEEAVALDVNLCKTEAGIQSQLAGIKHLNRLENVLARTEVVNRGQQEGLMVNALQNVISGTQSNLFLIKGSDLVTPNLNLSGVEGTTRYQLSLMAEELGLNWQVLDITLEDLRQTDELFLANAVRGIMPIQILEGRAYPIEQGQKIQAAWLKVQAENVLNIENIKLS